MMDKAKIQIVVIPGNLSKASHKFLSKPSTKTKSKIPYESHEERMKLAKLAGDRMKALRPESVKQNSNKPTVDHKGRISGGKPAYKNIVTKVSGEDSEVFDMNTKVVSILKPSEIGIPAEKKIKPVKSIGKKK